MSILVTRANQQGTEWKYESLAQVAGELKEVALPSSIDGLRRNPKTGEVYAPALQFAHAAYLHINLGYPVKKACALATKFVNSKLNRLEPLYTGSVADQCHAINTMESVDRQNFKDAEVDRALEALRKAQEKVDSLVKAGKLTPELV
jgi:hypothetical protein